MITLVSVNGRPLIGRLIALFDTSPLPDNSIITSARLSIFTSSPHRLAALWISGQAIPARTRPFRHGLGPLTMIPLEVYHLAPFHIHHWQMGYTMISLNSNGIGYISRTGITKLGVMDTGLDSVIVSTADSPGTSQDPKLTVTYTVP